MKQEKFESTMGELYKELYNRYDVEEDGVCTSYYDGVAKEVSQLIRSDSRIKNRFVEQIKRFMKWVDDYDEAFKKLRRRKKETYLSEGFPPNPRDWFIMRSKPSDFDKSIKNITLRPDKTRPPNEQELLVCCYVRLIVIHDGLRRLPGYMPIYFSQVNNVPGRHFDVCSELWAKIKYYRIGDEIEKEAKDLADEALATVKADLQQQVDLAEKPAETGQNAVPAKECWLWAGVKKVIEKGWQIFTKSFWDSVFDNLWPK